MTSLISIPLSVERDALVQHIDTRSMKRTMFQIQQILEVSRRPDFHHFVPFLDGVAMILDTNYADPVTIMWFDVTRQGWAGRIGTRQMLMDWKRVGLSLRHL